MKTGKTASSLISLFFLSDASAKGGAISNFVAHADCDGWKADKLKVVLTPGQTKSYEILLEGLGHGCHDSKFAFCADIPVERSKNFLLQQQHFNNKGQAVEEVSDACLWLADSNAAFEVSSQQSEENLQKMQFKDLVDLEKDSQNQPRNLDTFLRRNLLEDPNFYQSENDPTKGNLYRICHHLDPKVQRVMFQVTHSDETLLDPLTLPSLRATKQLPVVLDLALRVMLQSRIPTPNFGNEPPEACVGLEGSYHAPKSTFTEVLSEFNSKSQLQFTPALLTHHLNLLDISLPPLASTMRLFRRRNLGGPNSIQPKSLPRATLRDLPAAIILAIGGLPSQWPNYFHLLISIEKAAQANKLPTPIANFRKVASSQFRMDPSGLFHLDIGNLVPSFEFFWDHLELQSHMLDSNEAPDPATNESLRLKCFLLSRTPFFSNVTMAVVLRPKDPFVLSPPTTIPQDSSSKSPWLHRTARLILFVFLRCFDALLLLVMLAILAGLLVKRLRPDLWNSVREQILAHRWMDRWLHRCNGQTDGSVDAEFEISEPLKTTTYFAMRPEDVPEITASGETTTSDAPTVSEISHSDLKLQSNPASPSLKPFPVQSRHWLNEQFAVTDTDFGMRQSSVSSSVESSDHHSTELFPKKSILNKNTLSRAPLSVNVKTPET